MSEVQKSQAVRLADVWLIGPLLIYAGLKSRFSEPVNLALTFTGLMTIAYNWQNYAANKGKENVT